MKALRTWLLALFLMGCVLATPALAADTVASGTCGAEGDNLTWTLDSEGVLTISGTGAMKDYSNYDEAPWTENSSSILTVKLESGVTSIGKRAFLSCSKMTDVTIPEGVTSIGEEAFGGDGLYGSLYCGSLTSITIPNSVTSIGIDAFDFCKNLSSVTMGSGVTSIGDGAFSNCSGLEDVYIIDIDAWCRIVFNSWDATPMYYAKNLYLNGKPVTSVVVPQDVTALNYTFCGFKDLTQVTLPDSLTSIGDYAFYSCSSLTSISIPDSVTSIGRGAFLSCGSLVSISIPDSVTSIGNLVFSGCSKLINISIGSGVMSIGGQAFNGCSSLVRIDIPDSVSSIGYEAFSGCSSLVRISIGSGVSSIDGAAFSGCSSLTDVYLTDMDAWCRITFGNFDPDSTPMVYAKNIYLNGDRITSVTMPQGITAVQNDTFYGFRDLVTVTIPDGVTSIGERAFYGCSSLTGITIPGSVTGIGELAFYGCSSLADIIIPDSVTSIDRWAFKNCTSLQSIAIGSGVTNINGNDNYNSPFYGCKNLESVYITDMAAWCGIAFESNYANPLYYAKNLYLNGAKVETLEISEEVQVIPSYAFVNATCIQGVAIPKSLVGVAANAFTGCSGIEKVYYAGSETEWKDLAISAGNDPLTSAQIFYNATADDYYCRITVKISDGGRIFVDRNMAAEGETVTITTAPYAGYELSALYVDGAAIEGNTFTVTGNHVVSALFTKLPVTGGTQDYRLEGITVQTAEGEKLQELTAGKLLVSVSVRHLQGTEGATILLAQYDAQGRYQGLLWLTLDEMPLDMALKVTLPVDNSDGKIVNLKAFVVDSLLSAVLVGSAVSFGDV